MNFQETIFFYVVIGLGTAAAVGLAERGKFGLAAALSMLGAVLFWPLYLPLLLSGSRQIAVETSEPDPPRDELSDAIEQIERELNAALAGLDGWAEHVLNRNSGRLGELRSALETQADRIREMDLLLAREQPPTPETPIAIDDEGDSAERRRKSAQARLDNMRRLADVRRRARGDMLDTFAWIRELVSMIHLAKFTGAPASRAEELVAQIAAAVESISIVATTDAPRAAAPPSSAKSAANQFNVRSTLFTQPQGS